jgi:hypothetical protein
VQEYLAISEAPLTTARAFQQHGRRAEGVARAFWSRDCPLVASRLGPFARAAYCAAAASACATGLCILALNAVPVVAVLTGFFPVALNLYSVIGVTAFYAAMGALSYYCLTWSHLKVRAPQLQSLRAAGAAHLQ